VRAALMIAFLVGCSFDPSTAVRDDGGATNAPPDVVGDTGCAGWSYSPSNFDPCALARAGSALAGSGLSIDTDHLDALPHTMSTQSNGVTLAIVHVASLDVSGTWLTTGSAALVVAVDGAVTIEPGAVIVAEADVDDPAACTALGGTPGAQSNAATDGGGGGGGGAGAAAGEKGGDGDGGSHGAGGAKVNGIPGALTPLRGGCTGGPGGTNDGVGTPGAGGTGGGALQISSNLSIDVAGEIEAFGQGAIGDATQKTGAGGGGGGGGILLEAPMLHVEASGTVCADGGSGGNGGGTTSSGIPGNHSPCDGKNAASGANNGNNGGSGGDGGYSTTAAKAGTNATANAGGGGGGGGVGWIHLHGVPTVDVDHDAVVTPPAS
jgi:hypothetical protein